AASAEAEQAALFATFVIGDAATGAGAGIAAAAAWLDSCPVSTEVATTLRPITVLIVDSGRPDQPDSLTMKRVLQARTAAPVPMADTSSAGASLRVRSPDGFETGDRLITIGRDGTCNASVVTTVTPLTGGVTELGRSPASFPMPITGLVLNLGPSAGASTLRFDVASGSLRSTDLSNAGVPNPLVANVVNVKFRYGVDRNDDGALDEWMAADAASGMEAASVLAAPAATLGRIVALRIGVVARSESIDPQAAASFRWTLFDCAPAPPTTCPERIEGSITAPPGGGYRYATRELIIPLYNTLWNRPT
ncbi:MAG: PilW family protein, partial [Casimicrobiaceae bacterium]